MRNNKFSKTTGIIFLTIILVVVSIVAFLTHNVNSQTENPLLLFAINHHTAIMFVLVIVSISFGFIWSSTLYGEIQKKDEESKKTTFLLQSLLSTEERTIISFLNKNQGKSTQAHISKEFDKNRVKTFRTLKKMKEKGLVSVESKGKVRTITLCEILKK